MNYLKYLFMGFLITGFLHLLLNASCFENTTGPSGDKVDVGLIHQGANLVETAFANADTLELSQLLTESSLNLYRPIFSELMSAMPQYAEAFKNRKLSGYNELYAEYEFTVEGQRYTAAFVFADDRTWKLVRF